MNLHCADDRANVKNDFVSPVKHSDVKIADMTPELWRNMNDSERDRWHEFWSRKGRGCFQCMDCGFPIAFGWSPCECCDPGAFKERNKR